MKPSSNTELVEEIQGELTCQHVTLQNDCWLSKLHKPRDNTNYKYDYQLFHTTQKRPAKPSFMFSLTQTKASKPWDICQGNK